MELLLYLYAESPVHAGAADSLGVLDLPVQREAATGYPVIWGQSLKGALRQAAVEADWDPTQVVDVFGSPVREAEEGDRTTGADDDDRATTAGHLRVGDAQLVAMPVPTLRQTFAWATSQIALGRLARKYRALGVPAEAIPPVPQTRTGERGIATGTDWANRRGEVLGPCVVPFDPDEEEKLAGWAARIAEDAIGAETVFAPFAAKLRTDLLLVGGEIMPVLLRECTEQTVRVQLDENKTVRNGPFHSEYLPTETVLAASLSLREHNRKDEAEFAELVLNELFSTTPLIQVGGDETLGKGLMWARLVKAGA